MKEKASPPFSALWPVLGAKTEAGGGGGRSSREGLDLAPFLPLFCPASLLFFCPFLLPVEEAYNLKRNSI
jgi:hypothetical protein